MTPLNSRDNRGDNACSSHASLDATFEVHRLLAGMHYPELEAIVTGREDQSQAPPVNVTLIRAFNRNELSDELDRQVLILSLRFRSWAHAVLDDFNDGVTGGNER